jgi:hypothetical protein
MRYRNSKVDSHPNVVGSEMWATLLYDHMVRLGLIGRKTS